MESPAETSARISPAASPSSPATPPPHVSLAVGSDDDSSAAPTSFLPPSLASCAKAPGDAIEAEQVDEEKAAAMAGAAKRTKQLNKAIKDYMKTSLSRYGGGAAAAASADAARPATWRRRVPPCSRGEVVQTRADY